MIERITAAQTYNYGLEQNIVASRQAPKRVRKSAYEKEITPNDKLKAGIGSIIGTFIPMIFMMKKQKVKNPLKLSYGLKDMVILSGSAITGGVVVGMIGENGATRKNKFKEGVFQFLNAAIPTWIVGGVLKLAENNPKTNNIPCKTASIAAGLLVGMLGCAEISNLIFDPQDKRPDRKLTLKDCLVNIDDAIGVLVLAKFPFVQKLHIEKLLPLIYAYCGYRAGESN